MLYKAIGSSVNVSIVVIQTGLRSVEKCAGTAQYWSLNCSSMTLKPDLKGCLAGPLFITQQQSSIAQGICLQHYIPSFLALCKIVLYPKLNLSVLFALSPKVPVNQIVCRLFYVGTHNLSHFVYSLLFICICFLYLMKMTNFTCLPCRLLSKCENKEQGSSFASFGVLG